MILEFQPPLHVIAMIVKRPFYNLIPLLLFSLSTGAVAGEWQERQERQSLERNYSLDEVVSDVKRDHRGRVLSADTVHEEGRPVHRVRIINQRGRVRGFRFDGETGEPIHRPRR